MQTQQWTFDVIGGRPLPNCPFPSSSIPPIQEGEDPEGGRPIYHNPTTSTTLFLFALIFLIFAFLTVFKYSQVKIFNRIIKHPSVSNYYSVAFFTALSFACTLDGFRYALNFSHKTIQEEQTFSFRNGGGCSSTKLNFLDDSPVEGEERFIVGLDVIDSWLLLASMISRSFSLLLLTLSLNHQKNHRSVTVPEAPLSGISVLIPGVSDQESASLLINSPTFDATLVSEIPAADLSENLSQQDLNDISDSEERIPIPSMSSLLRLKWQMLTKRGKEVYSHLDKSGWLTPLVAISLFAIRVCVVISFVDSARLSDCNLGITQPLDMIYSNGVYIVSIIGFIVQITHVFIVAISIIHVPLVNARISGGPTLFARIILLASLTSTLSFWIEPSILCRIVIDLFGPLRNESLCIVPPWWWQKVKGFSLTHIPAHGWASFFDLALWISGIGIFGLFSFMKLEYTRNSDQWIAAAVSEVQSTFGFY